jgi:tetratricopeptide (TPR) repeat protein
MYHRQLLFWLLLPLLLAAPQTHAQADPLAALAAGNQAVLAGDLEAAALAYQSGYDPDALHPTLAYNLGTTLHQLERLPEAILWYRRASAAGKSSDPWLEDNLLLARRTLGSQHAGQPGFWVELRRNAGLLTGLALLFSWLGAITLLLAPRRRALAAAGLIVAAALQSCAWLTFDLAAKEAVLLRDCTTSAGILPAGSELWVLEDGPGFRIAGSRDASCPAEALELIHP